MNPKFGTADKWFTFGALLVPGIAAVVLGLASIPILKPWIPALLGGGIALLVLGLVGLVGGVLVWVYNQRHPIDALVVLGDKSAKPDVQIVELQERANRLRVERAGIAVQVDSREKADMLRGASITATFGMRDPKPEELLAMKQLAEWKARLGQIDAQVSGISTRIGQIRDEQKEPAKKRFSRRIKT